MNILFMIPLQEELGYFLQGCSSHGYKNESGEIGRLPVVKLPELGITLARGGTGKVQFGIQTQHLLDAGQDWDLVVCAGAAGALVDHLEIGDVVVATRTIEHDFMNRFSQRPLPTFLGAENALATLRELGTTFERFSLHFGPIASGDEDIVDFDRGRALHEITRALVAAWGGARACNFSHFPFLEIRAVSDAADHNAPANFLTNLSLAMQNMATVIVSWLG